MLIRWLLAYFTWMQNLLDKEYAPAVSTIEISEKGDDLVIVGQVWTRGFPPKGGLMGH